MSDSTNPGVRPADPLSELRALLPEAVTALSGVALTGLASLITPTSRRSAVDPSDLDRLQLLLRQERGWSQQREQELGDLRLALLAKENEADQLRRALRASAKEAEQVQSLRRRLARSNGAPSGEDAELRTYAWCRQFRMLPEAQRPPTSRALRAQYLRVAKMYGAWGDALDKAGIAFRWIRYVAYGEGIFEQKVRAAQILAGCRPRRPLRPHRDLSGEVVVRLSWLGLEENEAPALIHSLIEEGQGAAFVGRG